MSMYILLRENSVVVFSIENYNVICSFITHACIEMFP